MLCKALKLIPNMYTSTNLRSCTVYINEYRIYWIYRPIYEFMFSHELSYCVQGRNQEFLAGDQGARPLC